MRRDITHASEIIHHNIPWDEIRSSTVPREASSSSAKNTIFRRYVNTEMPNINTDNIEIQLGQIFRAFHPQRTASLVTTVLDTESDSTLLTIQAIPPQSRNLTTHVSRLRIRRSEWRFDGRSDRQWWSSEKKLNLAVMSQLMRPSNKGVSWAKTITLTNFKQIFGGWFGKVQPLAKALGKSYRSLMLTLSLSICHTMSFLFTISLELVCRWLFRLNT